MSTVHVPCVCVLSRLTCLCPVSCPGPLALSALTRPPCKPLALARTPARGHLHCQHSAQQTSTSCRMTEEIGLERVNRLWPLPRTKQTSFPNQLFRKGQNSMPCAGSLLSMATVGNVGNQPTDAVQASTLALHTGRATEHLLL